MRKMHSTTAVAVGAASSAVDLDGKAPGTGPLDWRAVFPLTAQTTLLGLLLGRLDRFGTPEGRTLLLAGLPDELAAQIRRADTPREDLAALVEGAARYDLAYLTRLLDNAAETVGQQSQTGGALRAWREAWHL